MSFFMRELYLHGFRFVSLLQRHAWIGLSTAWTATLETLQLLWFANSKLVSILIYCMDLVSPTATSTIVVAMIFR